jgi:gluconate 5-dehydrogenase
LVTGASKGIGLAISRALAEAGAHVVMNARGAAALEQSAALLRDAGLSVGTCAFDVTDAVALREGLAEVAGRNGGVIDIVVGNAGQSLRRPLEGFTPQDIQHLLNVNLGSAMLLAQAAVPWLTAGGRRGGRLLFTGSMLGQIARPGNALYSATKAGLAGLVRALAVDLGPKGVCCNIVAPGVVLTDMTKDLVACDPSIDQFVRSRTPLGRWATPEDVAQAMVFLASPAAAFITGQVLMVDGGMSVAA